MTHPSAPAPLRGTALKRFHRTVRRGYRRDPGPAIAFILENVAYPVNVGSLFRIADALDVDEVVLTGATADPNSPKAAKVGRGKHRRVRWRRLSSAADAIDALRCDGYWIAAIEITAAAVPFHSVAWPACVALVLGNEDHGVTRETLARCDSHVFVPMLGRGGSLNVHVAAAVVGYRARLGCPVSPNKPPT
jgi:tRNA (guanosine-2'-O-)-methyltransferase